MYWRNQRRDTILIVLQELGAGLVFSSDIKFLFASSDNVLYQYETAGNFNSSKYLLGSYYGFRDTVGLNLASYFGYWALAPDGRIYGAQSTSGTHLHVIDYPNEKGMDAHLKQHGLKIRQNYQSIPNFPHYRLSPWDG